MKVKSTCQLSYDNKLIAGGTEFEISDADYERLKKSVIIVKDKKPSHRKIKTKQIIKNKTK